MLDLWPRSIYSRGTFSQVVIFFYAKYLLKNIIYIYWYIDLSYNSFHPKQVILIPINSYQYFHGRRTFVGDRTYKKHLNRSPRNVFHQFLIRHKHYMGKQTNIPSTWIMSEKICSYSKYFSAYVKNVPQVPLPLKTFPKCPCHYTTEYIFEKIFHNVI